MSSLGLLAKTTGQTVTEIMEPHKDVLQDMIPPKKHLLRHQPLNAQIGLMVLFSAGLILWVGNAHLFCWPLVLLAWLMVKCSAGLILWVGNADLFCWPFAAQAWLMVKCSAGLNLWVGNADLFRGLLLHRLGSWSAGLILWVGNADLFRWPFVAQTRLVVRCSADLILWVGNADLWEGVSRSLTFAIIVVNFK